MSSLSNFEDLQAWQAGRQLVKSIYTISKAGPLSKDYALKDQLRRAAISVIANIAEGYERDSNKAFIYFLSIAKGSAGEVRSLLYVALDQGYIDRDIFEDLQRQTRDVLNLIGGFIRYLNNSEYVGNRNKRTQ